MLRLVVQLSINFLTALLLTVGWRKCSVLAASSEQDQFFVPLMMHGPNNQIIAIRETLALAKVLGRTMVLPDLRSHQFTDRAEEPMRFVDLFDEPYIKSNFDAILLDELPARLGENAWNRSLDAVVLLVPPDKANLTNLIVAAQGLQGPPRERWLTSPVTSWLGCSDDRVEQLRQLVAPYRTVGVQTFHGLLYGSQWLAGPMLVPCTDACCVSYKQTLPLLRKSAAVYALADRFIKEKLGGPEAVFVATHIRPYPDPCVRVWTQPDTPDRAKRMERFCNNEYLISRFAPSIQHMLTKYSAKALFVMSHPRIRAVVKDLLKKAGVEPVFMELDDVKAEPGGTTGLSTAISFSLLAMVEEAVCIRAKAFVGTKESSMTGTIVQERLSHGMSAQDTYSFFRRIGYEEKPVAVDDFYRLANMSVTGTDKWRQKLRERGVTEA